MAAFLLWLKTPSWLRSLGACLLVLGALAGAAAWIHHSIFQSGRDFQADIDEKEAKKINDAAETKLAAANANTATLQLKFDGTLRTTAVENAKKEMQHEKDLNSARAAVRAGALKLRLAVASCAISAAGQNQGAATDPGAGSEARADLMPGTADDILRIAGGYAKNVRDYNALVVQYNTAAAACNAP